ncbi:MAG: histidine kinase [Alistipes sp.]|nr:histidine kinase [Alistipes sp.]
MVSPQSKHTGLLVHLAVWGVVVGMPFVIASGRESSLTFQEYLRFLLVPASFMAVFYTNYCLLIDRCLFSRRVGRFFLSNAVLIALVMVALHLVFHYLLPPIHHRPMMRSWQGTFFFFASNAFWYLLAVGGGVAIRMTERWYRDENARRELERSCAEAELQNLKHQLNPHFLFNTLNNIYSLIRLDPVRAQQTVHDLSRLLRYVLYESSRPRVTLREEAEFLSDYIELMRIRLPRHVRCEVSLPDAASPATVAPLLFISLVENAFKHGVSNDAPSWIVIDLRERGDELVCRIENSYFPKPEDDRSGSGIGLQNLRRRLEVLYPGRYELLAAREGDSYVALLRIKTTDE